MPRRPEGSQATARCGRSPRIGPTSEVKVEPGPTSTKIRAPSACMAAIISANRTGRARCSPIWTAIAAGSVG